MSATNIKAVVFDFGGVIISPITEHIASVAQRHQVTMEDLLYVLMGPREQSTADHPWHRAERGEIPIALIPSLLGPWAAEKGITLDGDELDAVLGGTFVVRQAVVEAIGQLRAAGITIGLLTNSFKEYRAFVESQVDIDLFDHVIDSSEVGLRKPEPAIYRLVVDRLGCAPEQILYLDDFLANVAGALQQGWQAVHVTSKPEVLAALAGLTDADC